jgi:hypothetical protein
MRGLILALALGLASGAMAGAAAETVRPDPDSALAGRQIFQTGSSPGGTAITALVGRASVRLPGARLPCAGCHGADRRGGAEGGVNAPDITPTALTRPFRAAGTNRERPAYDAAALVRAVTAGIDAGGNPLDPAMPRFEMAATGAGQAYRHFGSARHDGGHGGKLDFTELNPRFRSASGQPRASSACPGHGRFSLLRFR